MKNSEWHQGLLDCEQFIQKFGLIESFDYGMQEVNNVDCDEYTTGWFACISHYVNNKLGEM